MHAASRARIQRFADRTCHYLTGDSAPSYRGNQWDITARCRWRREIVPLPYPASDYLSGISERDGECGPSAVTCRCVMQTVADARVAGGDCLKAKLKYKTRTASGDIENLDQLRDLKDLADLGVEVE